MIATRSRLLLLLAVLDGARALSTILNTLLRIRWWQGLQLVLCGSWTAVAAARCGENNCNVHLLEFKNALLAAESGYSLHRLNSLNSLNCHPSMHAPSLASGLFVESVGVVGVGRFGEGDTGVARWLGTARVDGSLHAGIQSVSACPNTRIRGLTECHGSSCGQLGSSPYSRVVRGPRLRGGTKQLSGRVHVGMWVGGNKNLNLRISQEKEIMTGCAGASFPSLIPFVTPVLPGPGSHIRMKMGWKVQSKTRKSRVWFFQNAGVGERVVHCRCSWVRLIGFRRDRTTQRGRFPVVSRVLVRTRTGKAQLSGHTLESGVGHCSPVCGGLSHP